MNKSALFGNNAVEFFEVEVIVSLSSIHDVGVVHHFSEFVIVHGFTQFSSNSLEAIIINVSVTFFIPELEDSSDTIS